MTTTVLHMVAFVGPLGQLPTIAADGFAVETQRATLAATVRITNPKKSGVASGVLLAKTGAVAYVLTAGHVVGDSDVVEVEVFSATSYPKPAARYAAARVIARQREGGQDLALVRIAGFAEELAGVRICPLGDAPA